MSIRLAILGASPFTRESHGPAVRAHADKFTVVAIYNRGAEAAQALAQSWVDAGCPSPDVYSGDDGLAAVLAREDVHAVSVVLASHLQPSFVEAALKAGACRVGPQLRAEGGGQREGKVRWAGPTSMDLAPPPLLQHRSFPEGQPPLPPHITALHSTVLFFRWNRGWLRGWAGKETGPRLLWARGGRRPPFATPVGETARVPGCVCAVFAGKHVMCEKPVAHTVECAKALLADYNKVYAPKGLVWAVLENYRFESGVVRYNTRRGGGGEGMGVCVRTGGEARTSTP
jgi:hypothetical protein